MSYKNTYKDQGEYAVVKSNGKSMARKYNQFNFEVVAIKVKSWQCFQAADTR